MIDYTHARGIADDHLVDFWGYLEEPLVIHCVIPHRCGWEFRFAPLRYMEFNVTHPLKGLLIGPGPFTVDRRDGSVEQHGSGDVDKTMLAWHRHYDAETGGATERPLGRDCGC